MRILLIGSMGMSAVQRIWIEEEFDANVQLCDNQDDLKHFLSKSNWDLLILNLDGDYYPAEILRMVKESHSKLPIIAISENADNEAVEAMRIGVFDYLAAPVENERLIASIQRVVFENPGLKKAMEQKFQDENNNEKLLLTEDVLFEGSTKMVAVKQVVDKILDADLPILISGESGTGKEMIARYIQAHSKRKGPFVKVNCAAIPSELLESELFGYERGAFTGAYRRKPGKFEAADKGFLFLDEISELSYPLQSKLLHVLQDGTVTTLGSTREVPVDVQILAATNQNLEDCVRKGTFRDDLFFRLNVVHINIPPIRDRLDHLGILIDYFCQKFAHQYNKRPIQLSPEARSFLFTYPWPGNIRELENAIKRATVLGNEMFLERGDGTIQMAMNKQATLAEREGTRVQTSSFSSSENDSLPHFTDNKDKTALPVFKMGRSLKEIAKEAALVAEREAIFKVLHQTRWNRKKTAKILDVSYKTLLTKIKETGLDEN
jgi:two-component system response regulator AtoC